jgi:hypothetical protein
LAVNADVVLTFDHELLLREDNRASGLGWFGQGKSFLNSFNPEGPVLYGSDGGGLATMNPSRKLALSWDRNAVYTKEPLHVEKGLIVDGDFSLNRKDLYPRDDRDSGLGWYGPQKGFGGDESIDGPVLYGASGGALGTPVASEVRRPNTR